MQKNITKKKCIIFTRRKSKVIPEYNNKKNIGIIKTTLEKIRQNSVGTRLLKIM